MLTLCWCDIHPSNISGFAFIKFESIIPIHGGGVCVCMTFQ